jgi:PII-like signaling protein
VTEYQKLTSYFGERKRSGGAFVADALLELYGRHEIAASILLRGTEGFGLKHHLRTDRSLSLSEDLPLVAVAVDTRPRIEELLGPALALNRTGLVTVEGARLLDDTAVSGPDEETKLTVYLGRQERAYRVPAFVAVCDLLHRRGVDGATALLGVDGTAHGRRQRAAFFSRNAEVPMMIIAVGAGEQISRVLPELGALLRRRCSPWSGSVSASGTARACPDPAEPGPAEPGPAGTGRPAGRSSWSTRLRRSGTRASRCTAPSSSSCARPGSAAPPRCSASGASMATTPRTATGCCSWAGTYPP